MRPRRGSNLGWAVVGAFTAAVASVSIAAVNEPDFDRSVAREDEAAERFTEAWERSRTATYLAAGIYERHSEVTGATLQSEDVVAQRPPRRLHRQLGGVDGRDDDRVLTCPAPPEGATDRAPCQLGPHSGISYAEGVGDEVAGVRSLTQGAAPLYAVAEPEPGCFHLTLTRADPRAPFGVRASFCFDRVSGAVRASSVHHAGGIVEVLSVTSIRRSVTAADLQP